MAQTAAIMTRDTTCMWGSGRFLPRVIADAETFAEFAGLAAVEAQFLAVGQYGALEPHDLLAVGELIADARDHVARLHRRLGPAVGLHAVDGGPTDHPFLLPALIGRNLK